MHHTGTQAETLIGREVLAALNALTWRGRRACFLARRQVGTFRAMHSDHVVRTGLPGMPDYAGFLCTGRALEVETKSKRGVLTDEQKAFRQLCEEMNVVHLVPRSAEETVAGVLAALEKQMAATPVLCETCGARHRDGFAPAVPVTTVVW